MRSDWEARQFGDFALQPQRARAARGLPDQRRRLADPVSNFNAVGGSTILYAAHFPRFHPSDFRVRTLDGVADDWPIDYATLEPYYDVNARMMGVSGLAGDPAYPPKEVPLPPVALGKLGETLARGFNRARLALVAVGQRDHDREYEGRARLHQRRHCLAGLRAGREGEHRHHLLAGGAAPGRAAPDPLPRARDHRRRERHGRRRHLLRRRRASSGGSGARRGRRVQRHRHAAPAPELALEPSPTGSPIAAASSART